MLDRVTDKKLFPAPFTKEILQGVANPIFWIFFPQDQALATLTSEWGAVPIDNSNSCVIYGGMECQTACW